jgi:hypothetical protein
LINEGITVAEDPELKEVEKREVLFIVFKNYEFTEILAQ